MVATRKVSSVRALAWLCAALVFAVTCLSAFIRLAREAASGHAANAIAFARGAHRVSASLALVLAIVLLVWCYTRVPPMRRQGRLAGAVVALGLFLALVGSFGGDSTSPVVVLANFIGGLVMVAFATAMAIAFTP
jgi:cytochrome c oxidase assembly protein subunit 15